MKPRIAVFRWLTALAVGLTGVVCGQVDDDEGELIRLEEQSPCAGEKSCTTEELIAEAEKLAPQIPSILASRGLDGTRTAFGDIFSKACARADNEQLDKLIEIYRTLKSDSFEKSYYLWPLASRCIHREAMAMASEHRRVKLRGTEIPVPSELTKASDDLQAAWLSYKRAELAYTRVFPRNVQGEKIEAYLNSKTFYNLVADALANPKKDLISQLRSFVDGGANCMNITDISDAKNFAILVILLRERELDEAIGAALRIIGTAGSTSKPDASVASVIETLKACGQDWETLFVGALIDGRESCSYNKNAFLDALVKIGSGRSADLVNEISHLAPPQSRTLYVEAFSRWIESAKNLAKPCGEDSRRVYGSDERTSAPIPVDIQKKCLRTTEEFATATCGEELAWRALDIFARTQSERSLPAIRTLAQHSDNDVATSAADLLCAMGERSQQPISGEVRFQVRINGEVLPEGTDLCYEISSKDRNDHRSVTTKADGILEVERKHVANPRRPVSEVKLGGYRPAKGLLFEKEVPVPSNLDSITLIEIDASELEFSLGNLDHINAPAPKTADVRIEQHREHWQILDRFPFSRGDSLAMSADSKIIFPRVQHGTYDVWIRVPGAEIWHEVVEVNEKSEPVDVQLKPASDVRFEVFGPDGRPSWGYLMKDGQRLEIQPEYRDRHLYRALPSGNYVLHIEGRQLAREQHGEVTFKPGPDEVPFEGRDIAFIIREGSPAVIDLGKIQLEALPAKTD